MKNQWQLQVAKNRFSEVIEKAQTEGPQIVTRRGEQAAAIISISEYRRLTQTQNSLLEFMSKSPLRDVTLDLSRSKDKGRKVNL